MDTEDFASKTNALVKKMLLDSGHRVDMGSNMCFSRKEKCQNCESYVGCTKLAKIKEVLLLAFSMMKLLNLKTPEKNGVLESVSVEVTSILEDKSHIDKQVYSEFEKIIKKSEKKT